MEIQYRRRDGTFVATINGMPYHVTVEDPLFDQAQIDGAEAPFEPVPEPEPLTPEQQQAAIAAAIDAHVEATARARGYNGAAHLASYVASGVAIWAQEATAFVAWRDAVWLAAYDALDAAMAAGAAPEAADVIAALPVIDWPEA